MQPAKHLEMRYLGITTLCRRLVFTWRLQEVTGSAALGGAARGRKIEGASTLRPLRPRSTELRSF